jgi:diaminohydroxyphosphoribosylaminopyrimidine deaminase/5-amino-6-(5-phosphoribosylamino)uracil reductase
MIRDEKYMRLALELAEKGKGKTSPNPMVGAVVVKSGRILARGYHRKVGGPHAEATALKTCGEQAKGASLYTTLEPCCHFGKTPPCTDLIIRSGITRVICATIDPNPRVNGKGIENLKDEGTEVSLGILEKQARELNEVYFKCMTTGLPFVGLALAQTLDGRIIHQAESSGNKRPGVLSQLIRSRKLWADAILCDAAITDADYAAVFLRSSISARPKVILFGTWGEMSSWLKRSTKKVHKNLILVPTDSGTVGRKRRDEFAIWSIKTRKNGSADPVSVLRRAGQEGMTNLLLGGGNRIVTSFLKQRLVDKIWYLISPRFPRKGEEPFGDLGIRRIRNAINLKNCEFKQMREGLLVVGYPAEAGSQQLTAKRKLTTED